MSKKALEILQEHLQGWEAHPDAWRLLYFIAWRVRIPEDAEGDLAKLREIEEWQQRYNVKERQVRISRKDLRIAFGGGYLLEIVDNPEHYTPEKVDHARARLVNLDQRIRRACVEVEKYGIEVRTKIMTPNGNRTTAMRGHETVFYFPTDSELQDASKRKIKANFAADAAKAEKKQQETEKQESPTPVTAMPYTSDGNALHQCRPIKDNLKYLDNRVRGGVPSDFSADFARVDADSGSDADSDSVILDEGEYPQVSPSSSSASALLDNREPRELPPPDYWECYAPHDRKRRAD